MSSKGHRMYDSYIYFSMITIVYVEQHKCEACHEYEHTRISIEQRERRGLTTIVRNAANNHDAWPINDYC